MHFVAKLRMSTISSALCRIATASAQANLTVWGDLDTAMHVCATTLDSQENKQLTISNNYLQCNKYIIYTTFHMFKQERSTLQLLPACNCVLTFDCALHAALFNLLDFLALLFSLSGAFLLPHMDCLQFGLTKRRSCFCR